MSYLLNKHLQFSGAGYGGLLLVPTKRRASNRCPDRHM